MNYFEELSILSYDASYSDRILLTCRGSVDRPSSGLKSKLIKHPAGRKKQ
jgi:hypothetical protein